MRLVRAILAAMIAVATPAQAAFVSYVFESHNGANYRTDTCSPSGDCFNVLDVGVTGDRVQATFTFDTSAPHIQAGDPVGGGYTYLLGGSNYGFPPNLTASFEIIGGGVYGNQGTHAGTLQSWVIGGFETNIMAEFRASETAFDSNTGEISYIYNNIQMHALISGAAPLRNIDNVWLPGINLSGTGQLYYSKQTYVERYDSLGEYLGSESSSFNFYDIHARFRNQSSPVPEPAQLGLLGLGILGIAARKRRPAAGI